MCRGEIRAPESAGALCPPPPAVCPPCPSPSAPCAAVPPIATANKCPPLPRGPPPWSQGSDRHSQAATGSKELHAGGLRLPPFVHAYCCDDTHKINSSHTGSGSGSAWAPCPGTITPSALRLSPASAAASLAAPLRRAPAARPTAAGASGLAARLRSRPAGGPRRCARPRPTPQPVGADPALLQTRVSIQLQWGFSIGIAAVSHDLPAAAQTMNDGLVP